MADNDLPPTNDPILAPASALPQQDRRAAPIDETPIFSGSVSLLMGFRIFVLSCLLDVAGVAMAWYGSINPQTSGHYLVIAGVALLIASNLMLAWSVLRIRCQRYKITRKLIEREQGIIFKRVDALDLSRVKDVELSQNLIERIFNIGTILVFSSDRTDPVMRIEAIPNARLVYEKMRDAVIEISQRRGIVSMG